MPSRTTLWWNARRAPKQAKRVRKSAKHIAKILSEIDDTLAEINRAKRSEDAIKGTEKLIDLYVKCAELIFEDQKRELGILYRFFMDAREILTHLMKLKNNIEDQKAVDDSLRLVYEAGRNIQRTTYSVFREEKRVVWDRHRGFRALRDKEAYLHIVRIAAKEERKKAKAGKKEKSVILTAIATAGSASKQLRNINDPDKSRKIAETRDKALASVKDNIKLWSEAVSAELELISKVIHSFNILLRALDDELSEINNLIEHLKEKGIDTKVELVGDAEGISHLKVYKDERISQSLINKLSEALDKINKAEEDMKQLAYIEKRKAA